MCYSNWEYSHGHPDSHRTHRKHGPPFILMSDLNEHKSTNYRNMTSTWMSTWMFLIVDLKSCS